MWYGKNDNRYDEEFHCKCCSQKQHINSQNIIVEIKKQQKIEQLKNELEKHFFEVLENEF